MPASQKKRAQGGGRTANSEPRQQVFRDFGGCNFQMSPRDFTLGKDVYQEQSDLQMNYVVVQNNICLTDNKTLETRNNLVKLFSVPDGKKFTDASILIGDKFFIGTDDGTLWHGFIGTDSLSEVTLTNRTGSAHNWESFAYFDNKLIATTSQKQLWSGLVDSYSIENAAKINNPSALTTSDLTPQGSLNISSSFNQTHTNRLMLTYAYIGKYGPTKAAGNLTIYTNKPVEEWNAGCYLTISKSLPTSSEPIIAVELYFSEGNSQEMTLANRVDLVTGDTNWTINFMGYLDITSMWAIGNLKLPEENMTQGVPASRVACIDSRAYFWGNSSEPQRLYIGGNTANSMLSTAVGTGGGFVDVEPGTGQSIRIVDKYKTQSGNSIVTMLCDSKNSSKEQRYNLVENSIEISNEQSMKSWQAEQVAGAVGCKSYHGARVCEDGLYSVSRYGLALTTMTMEYNSQIMANYVSDPIKPVFIQDNGEALANAVLLECDGILYLAFGKNETELDKIIFCYDIDLKAWYTISLDEDIDEPIIDMLHIDYEGSREGIGIVTENSVYLLPLTKDDDIENNMTFDVTFQTGELSTQQPQQTWFYLSQLEFRFDYFVGDIDVELTGIDQFGRKIITHKKISHDDPEYNLTEWMRVDLRLQSYQLRITGKARFRMTHFISKLYTMSAKQGLVWGFDDRQSYRSSGEIHPTFKNYNDVRKAIFV